MPIWEPFLILMQKIGQFKYVIIQRLYKKKKIPKVKKKTKDISEKLFIKYKGTNIYNLQKVLNT